ncbi:unnamed protein product, partial [Urochloa humidicola]
KPGQLPLGMIPGLLAACEARGQDGARGDKAAARGGGGAARHIFDSHHRDGDRRLLAGFVKAN